MHMKSGRVLSALLATVVLGVGAIELDANLAARAGLRQVLAAHPGLSVAGVVAEPLSGHLMLRGLRLAAGATQVTIGALDVPMPRRNFALVAAAQASPFDDKTEDESGGGGVEAPASEAPAARSGGGPATGAAPAPAATATAVPGTTTADDVAITRGTTTFRIKHVELAGSPLSNADLAAVLDAKSTETLESRLRKLTATAVTVPEVEIDDSVDGARQHLVLNQVVLAGATKGKVASGTIGGTVFTQKADTADSKKNLDWTTGPIVATGIDFAQIARLFEAERTDDAEPVLPLFESVTVTNFKSLAGKGKAFTIAAIKETGAKARALKAGTFPKKGEGPQTDAQKAVRYADVVQSVAIGSIELQDISGGDSDTKISLASIALKDFTGGKLGGLTIGALAVEAPKVKVSLGSITLGPVTLPPPSAIEKGPSNAAGTMIPPDLQIAIDKLVYDADMADAEKNEPPKRVAFDLGRFQLVSKGRSGELPSDSTMTIANLSFDVPPTESGKPLLDMGYRHVDVSMNATTVYDADGQTLLLKDLSLQGVDMGSLMLSVGFINVTKGVTSPDPEVAKGSVLAILVKSLMLDVVNKGLAEKALARQAAADGVSVEKERDGLVDLFAVKLPASVNNSANAKLIGAAVAKFIADPKTLHVGIVSKSGLGAGSVGMLADPGLLLDSLDVTAGANQ